jgi:hypothetical protein
VVADETVLRQPHDAHSERIDGRKVTTVNDPRTSITIQEEGSEISLFFDPDRAFAGDATLLEVRLTPAPDGTFEPWRLLPNLPLHTQYARAVLANSRQDIVGALSALRQSNAPRRGLSNDFLRTVARLHESLVSEGERYPVKAIARSQRVDISTASRWVAAARKRGFLQEGS